MCLTISAREILPQNFELCLIPLRALVGLPLSLILIPRMGVTGLLITMITATLAGIVCILFWISRNFGFSLDWRASAKIYLSSAIAFAPISLLLPQAKLQY